MTQAVELSDKAFQKLVDIATKLQNRHASEVMEACIDAMIGKINNIEAEKANEIFAEQAEESFLLPSGFDGANAVFGPPAGMSEAEVYSLIAAQITYNGLPAIVTCWKPTAEQLEHIKDTGRVWVMLMGRSMQPICLSSQNPLLFPWTVLLT
jgi:hypothetical protein